MKLSKKDEEIIEIHLRQGNISLILDSYDDIFSDFDPRPYDKRTLSDDFLEECKKATRGKTQDPSRVELRLLVPSAKRNTKDEDNIKKRLLQYFEKHYHEEILERTQLKKEGIITLLIGAFLTFMGAFFYGKTGFLYDVLVVLIEPAGWFTMWTGFDKLLVIPRSTKHKYEFFRKMAHIDINFHSY